MPNTFGDAHDYRELGEENRLDFRLCATTQSLI
jgi:hypothetical protein